MRTVDLLVLLAAATVIISLAYRGIYNIAFKAGQVSVASEQSICRLKEAKDKTTSWECIDVIVERK